MRFLSAFLYVAATAWRGERSIRRADAAVVVHAISVTVLRLVSGGLYGGPGGETPSPRRPRGRRFSYARKGAGKERAFEGSATVWNGGSAVVAAAAAAGGGGGGLRYQVKGGPKRRAPESGERATCAGDVALRLHTNHSKQRFAAETAHLFPCSTP